jgi:hypothetical protein
MEKEKVSPERFLGMQAGNAEFQSRLLDLIRGGLVELDLSPPQYFEEFAARMVDAQLGSIAKRIRSWATFREQFPDTWHEKLLNELGELYIFSKAFQHFDRLSDSFQDELLAQAGVTTRTSDLFQQQGVQDEWLVLGQVATPEVSNLTSRRTWLIGKDTKNIVLLLEYSFGSSDFTTLWLKEIAYAGEAVYYPTAYPLRVAFKSVDVVPLFTQISGYLTIATFLEAYSAALAQNPWLPQFPAVLTSVKPVFYENKFLLIDIEKKFIYTEGEEMASWQLLAMSGGHSISVFGEWDGQVFKVLNMFSVKKD